MHTVLVVAQSVVWVHKVSSASTLQKHTALLPVPASLTTVWLCSKKLGTPVPRLDLTPVLASMAAEQDGTPDTAPDSHSHQGMLLLEDAPRRRLELDGDADEDPHSECVLNAHHTPRDG